MAADSDSRKRTLEALEKRLALSKAQISDKEKPKKITPQRRPKLSRPHPHHPPSASPNAHKPNPKLKPPPSLTPNKGNVNFSGYYFFKEIEEDDPTYAELPHDVNENLLTTNDKSCTDRKSSVESILHELFSKGDNAKKYMHGAKSYTIDNMILLDNVVQGSSRTSGSQARALQIHSKRSKKHMSMKQHKKNGSLDLPQEFHKFDLFKPMQEMWNDYILKLLKPSRNNQLVLCLLGADLHGAFILVVECKIIHFTGTCGIMIRETAETFGIITEANKFHVVPKKGSVFVFQVDCWKVTVHGDKLSSRKIGLHTNK